MPLAGGWPRLPRALELDDTKITRTVYVFASSNLDTGIVGGGDGRNGGWNVPS